MLSKLEPQKTVFGNPSQIISDRGTAFSSAEFKTYCDAENIKHHMVTTGLPRSNGQVEQINRTILSVLAKLSVDEPSKWYQHVTRVQRAINSTHHRSIGSSPFELLIGVPMKQETDLPLTETLTNELLRSYSEERLQRRLRAKKQIARVQDENRRHYNLRRREAIKYRVGDLVFIKRTQFGSGLKLKPKYLGPYRITKVKQNDTYDVVKEAEDADGAIRTSTCAEYMKPFVTSGPEVPQDGRM